MNGIKFLLLTTFLLVTVIGFAQDKTTAGGQSGGYIPTAVPFLNIAPESRGGGMGNVGVATSSDANSQCWNPAKYGLGEQSFGASLSYTPWLKQLVNDINLYYIGGFYKIDKMQTISSSLRYFTYGSIVYTGESGSVTSTGNPNEFAFDVAYTRLLGRQLSASVALRYIRSDLYNGVGDGSQTMYAANAYAADIAFYYLNKTSVGGLKSEISAGLNMSNIGSKVSYDNLNKEFLPANFRLGVGYKVEIDQYNTVALAVDLNKLMVPTTDYSVHTRQYYSDMSSLKGVSQSFSDAPGGFSEELKEISISTGLEYWYNNVFAARAGYFHENENKGNRKFFTAGVGLKFNMFQIDASYIIPVQQNNPLANTIRFSLSFDLSQYNTRKNN